MSSHYVDFYFSLSARAVDVLQKLLNDPEATARALTACPDAQSVGKELQALECVCYAQLTHVMDNARAQHALPGRSATASWLDE